MAFYQTADFFLERNKKKT